MQFRIGIVIWSMISAGAGLSGCATGGGSGNYQTFMQKCTEAAKTEEERSNCAWKNAERMASGN
jgi:hypothetical protein